MSNRVKISLSATSVYSGAHCDHWCTFGDGSVGCGSITELVWIFFLSLDCVVGNPL